MAITQVKPSEILIFYALSTDIVNNKLVNSGHVGSKVFIVDTKTWYIINPDSTLSLLTDAPVCGSIANAKTAKILIGEGSTNVIDLAGETLKAIIMPAEWTASTIAFMASHDNVSWSVLYYNGVEHQYVEAGAGRWLTTNPLAFNAVRYLIIRSGLAGASVPQVAEREFVLLTKPNI